MVRPYLSLERNDYTYIGPSRPIYVGGLAGVKVLKIVVKLVLKAEFLHLLLKLFRTVVVIGKCFGYLFPD